MALEVLGNLFGAEAQAMVDSVWRQLTLADKPMNGVA